MGIEHEPRLERVNEAYEGGPAQQNQPPESPASKADTAEVAEDSAIREDKPELPAETSDSNIAFYELPSLLGKRVLFRDPHNTLAIGDPLYKEGTLTVEHGEIQITIDRSIYPIFYDHRPTGGYVRLPYFVLSSQEDIDRYDVRLLEE